VEEVASIKVMEDMDPWVEGVVLEVEDAEEVLELVMDPNK